MMDFFCEATSEIPRDIGRISPLTAPAMMRRAAGEPEMIITSVETAMNPITHKFS